MRVEGSCRHKLVTDRKGHNVLLAPRILSRQVELERDWRSADPLMELGKQPTAFGMVVAPQYRVSGGGKCTRAHYSACDFPILRLRNIIDMKTADANRAGGAPRYSFRQVIRACRVNKTRKKGGSVGWSPNRHFRSLVVRRCSARHSVRGKQCLAPVAWVGGNCHSTKSDETTMAVGTAVRGLRVSLLTKPFNLVSILLAADGRAPLPPLGYSDISQTTAKWTSCAVA
jgi:hypothetical protein